MVGTWSQLSLLVARSIAAQRGYREARSGNLSHRHSGATTMPLGFCDKFNATQQPVFNHERMFKSTRPPGR